MDDSSIDKDSKRRSRNLSEKKRRDQFNTLVTDLNTMVSPKRKMDKSTVLKSTIALLKKHNEMSMKSRISEIGENWKPKFLTNEEFIYLLLEAIDGFIIIFSTSGQIFYISESVTSLLGYLPAKLLKMTLFEIAHEDSRTNLYTILMDPPKQKEQVSFSCYIRRREAEIESNSYELVNFIGIFRPDTDKITSENGFSEFSCDNDLRLLFIGTGTIQTPQLIRETALIDAAKVEFSSRHSLEWKFLFLDHRAAPIIGYLPFELLGTSGYDYYHVDDLEEMIKCHEILMQRGEGTSSYYRFLTKGQQWIWLQTRYYITYHQWNSKPEFIVCSHRVISYLDVIACESNRDDDLVVNDNLTPIPWASKNNKNNLKKLAVSDCTSLSAESPRSRHSVISLNSAKSADSYGEVSLRHHISHQNIPSHQELQCDIDELQSDPIHRNQQHLLEPKAYENVIPMPIVTAFPTPSVLTLREPTISSTAQNQIQTDLQRKHAELQASIEQKQAELRRVSEQLVMARLGIMLQNDPQSDVHH